MTDRTRPTRGAVASWGLWDWAFSAFMAIAGVTIALSAATGTAARTSWGILGILVGLAVLLPVKQGQELRAPAPARAEVTG